VLCSHRGFRALHRTIFVTFLPLQLLDESFTGPENRSRSCKNLSIEPPTTTPGLILRFYEVPESRNSDRIILGYLCASEVGNELGCLRGVAKCRTATRVVTLTDNQERELVTSLLACLVTVSIASRAQPIRKSNKQTLCSTPCFRSSAELMLKLM
jgi:hypothetical protein